MTKRKVTQPDLIDLLLADYKKPEDLLGENGILKQLTRAVVERA
jgi:putative transposase